MSIHEEYMRKAMFRPESLSVQQIQQAVQSGLLPGYIGIPLLQEKIKQQKQAAQGQAVQGMPNQPPVAQQVMQEAQGIEGLPGDVPMEHMAGGGIIAFAEGGKPTSWSWNNNVEDEYTRALKRQPSEEAYGEQDWGERYSRNPAEIADFWARFRKNIGYGSQLPPEKRQWPEDIVPTLPRTKEEIAPKDWKAYEPPIKEEPPAPPPAGAASNVPPPAPAPITQLDRSASGIAGLSDIDRIHQMFGKMPEAPTVDTTKSEASIAERRKEYESGKENNKWDAMIQAGLAMMAGSSPYAMQNIGAGGIAGLKQYASGEKDLRDLHKEIADAEAKVEAAQNEGKMRPYAAAVKERDEKIGIWKTLEAAQMHRDVATIQANKGLQMLDKQGKHEAAATLRQRLGEIEKAEANLTTDPERLKVLQAERVNIYKQISQLLGIELGVGESMSPAATVAPAGAVRLKGR